MKFEHPNCPNCGALASAVMETYVARTPLCLDEETGELEFAGGTEIDYESGELVEDDDGVLLMCGTCHKVFRSVLVPEGA